MQAKSETYAYLIAELNELNRQIVKVWKEERRQALHEIRYLMRMCDITPSDLARYLRSTQIQR